MHLMFQYESHIGHTTSKQFIRIPRSSAPSPHKKAEKINVTMLQCYIFRLKRICIQHHEHLSPKIFNIIFFAYYQTKPQKVHTECILFVR